MSGGPIFVAGLERTGTSLMYALLASHPDISMTRRTNFWTYFVDQFGDLADDENVHRCIAQMRVYKRFVVLDVDYDDLTQTFLAGPRTYARLYACMQEQIASRRGKSRWGDKSLNIERVADDLVAAYPDVRILHMVRDPRDRLASVLTRWGKRRAGTSLGTTRWVWSARLASSHSTAYPDNYRIVRYETLVADPEAELRRICDFIDADFTPEMLEMQDSGSFQGSNSSYADTERPTGTISSSSVRKYERTLTPRQVALVHASAGGEMRRHGYDPHPVDLAPMDRVRLEILDRPSSRLWSAIWRTREGIDNRRGRPLPDYRIVEVDQ